MADFARAIPGLITAEGGYKTVNVKGDRGGTTYAGITRRTYPRWKGWDLPDSSLEKIRMVQALYKEHYWDKIKGDQIKSQALAESMFHWVVLAGIRTPVKALQRLVCVPADGIMGPQTLRAVNFDDDVEQRILLHEIFVAKIKRRVQIAKTTSQLKFLRGWINRALKHIP